MLLSAAKKEYSHIEQIPDVLPPRFRYREVRFSNQYTENETAEPEELMARAFSQYQTNVKKQLSEIIKDMDSTPFEHLVNRLIAKVLFGESEDTPPSHDGGIDGLVQISSDPLGLNIVGIQAKHYTSGRNVQSDEMDNFIGALNGKNGVFVTWSDFSRGAKEKAEHAAHSKIILINGEQLLDYMVKYKVGIRETGISYTLSKLDKDFFDEL